MLRKNAKSAARATIAKAMFDSTNTKDGSMQGALVKIQNSPSFLKRINQKAHSGMAMEMVSKSEYPQTNSRLCGGFLFNKTVDLIYYLHNNIFGISEASQNAGINLKGQALKVATETIMHRSSLQHQE